MLSEAETWILSAGGLSRRGIEIPIVAHDFSELTVQNPISLADFRLVVGDPTVSGDTQIMQVVNDPTYGKVIRITLSGPYYNGGTEGIAWQADLPRSLRDCYIEYWVRFNSGFKMYRGGKLPGLGGHTASIANPPSGGTHTPHGYSSRLMWLADDTYAIVTRDEDDELTIYLYSPKQTEGWGLTRVGSPPVGLGASGTTPNTTSTGTAHRVRQRIRMNDVSVDGDTSPPTNGIHQLYVDGQQVYSKTDEVFRLYQAGDTDTIMWSIFRGGGDSSWSQATSGTIDIWGFKVVEILDVP